MFILVFGVCLCSYGREFVQRRLQRSTSLLRIGSTFWLVLFVRFFPPLLINLFAMAECGRSSCALPFVWNVPFVFLWWGEGNFLKVFYGWWIGTLLACYMEFSFSCSWFLLVWLVLQLLAFVLFCLFLVSAWGLPYYYYHLLWLPKLILSAIMKCQSWCLSVLIWEF